MPIESDNGMVPQIRLSDVLVSDIDQVLSARYVGIQLHLRSSLPIRCFFATDELASVFNLLLSESAINWETIKKWSPQQTILGYSCFQRLCAPATLHRKKS